MWKTAFFLRGATTFYAQPYVDIFLVFHRENFEKKKAYFSTIFFSHFTGLVEKLQQGIYVCSNVTDIVLQGGIALFQV